MAEYRGHYGEALFEPDEADESARIDYGAITYDPISRDRLADLGVGPGWRCLELGAGTGTIARWLAEDVGVAQVIAVDRDVRFLTHLASDRLRPLEADLTSADFRPADFDLVHARFLLMHLTEYRELLARMADWLGPGGWLVVSDAVDLTTEGAPESSYRATMQAMWQGLKNAIGTDVSWTPRYPYFLAELGLADVGAEIYVPPRMPGGPVAAFWLQTWAQLRGEILATGQVDAKELQVAQDSLRSGSCVGLSPGMITAWGRKPG
jgi:SAM-dependent methyltransferase